MTATVAPTVAAPAGPPPGRRNLYRPASLTVGRRAGRAQRIHGSTAAALPARNSFPAGGVMVPLGAVRSDTRKRLMESTVEPPCDGRDVDQYPPRSASPRPGGRGAAGRVPAPRTGDICSICGTVTHAVLAGVPDRVWTVIKDTTDHQPVCLDCLDDLVRAAGFTPGWVIRLTDKEQG